MRVKVKQIASKYKGVIGYDGKRFLVLKWKKQ